MNKAPFGPSNLRVQGKKFKKSKPVPMTRDDIVNAIEKFRLASKAVKDAGFSGLEIHAAHGYRK